MADIRKLAWLLDNPEVRVVLFGLAHAGEAPFSTDSGASGLRASVLRVVEATSPDQYQSWLSDDTHDIPMTVEQVRATFGDELIDKLAQYADSNPGEVAWQLAAVLPDLVAALSPRGRLVEVSELRQDLLDASAAGDQSAGPFGPHLH